ncbi:MAG: ATP synthase F1 subunit delta [bacterium]
MKLRSKAARRYAMALHGLALGDVVLDAVGVELTKLQGFLEGSEELRRFMGNYLLPSERREQTLVALFGDRMQPLVWRFVRFLESKQRLGILGEICEEFRGLEELRQGIVHGRLASAFAVSPDDAGEIATRAGSRIGKQLILETEENPGLIGGCRLQVGDTVYDFSLAAQLRMLRQTMMAG